MIKDANLRIIFIPLLGICLPLIAGLITYELYSIPELIGANLFFIFTSFAIWMGCNWIHGKVRMLYAPSSNPFTKIASICFISGLYGICIGTISTLSWLKFSRETFSWSGFYKFPALCTLAVIVFTLIYEVLFLSKERELDTKIVDQLDKERSQAELQVLNNELDPHFMFNSLNTLNHLILNNPQQAYLFNNRLAQVYKYVLINKSRDLVSLTDELEFIDNYFFLLQIRHDSKMQLTKDIGKSDNPIMIPPCALQILMENAIKHNEFSEANPLQIEIRLNEKYLKVINNIKPKPYSVNSTGIGLKNLSSRYKLICHKDILIESSNEKFTVKLPLINP